MSTADLPPEVKRTLAQEFFDFLKTFGIIGLAIAFVIGQAASRLVTALVNDIIDPIIGFFLPAGSLDTLTFKITNLSGSTTEFKYGDLISNRLSHYCFDSISSLQTAIKIQASRR